MPQMAQAQLRPQPVVLVLSPVGVEYIFQTITLFTGAIAAIAVLIAVFNGKKGLTDLALPAAVLLITVPVFAFLFLRHKKLEMASPDLRFDPSKRRSTQFTQIISFTACLFTVIAFVSDIFLKVGGQFGPSIFKALLDALAILIVAGGILYYYWRDEHKQN